MIGHLSGSLLRRGLPSILIDVGGVGYSVDVPLRTFESLPPEGDPVRLEIFTLVRAESLQLFGFDSLDEKELFETMLGVSGIGPRLALAILSGVSPAILARAVEEERGAELESIPGVGKKTARRIILELKDKLDGLRYVAQAHGASSSEAPVEAGLAAEACDALESLGFKRAEAERAIRAALAGSLLDGSSEPPLALLIKDGLRHLRAGR